MKFLPLFSAALLFSTPAMFAAEPAVETAPTLEVGATMSPEVLGKLTWLRGEAPTAWEPGHVYVFECWATWCGPCIAAIPHVNALHEKYHSQGLRIYGMNVWEADQAKVEKFIKAQGDKMTYPIAFSGEAKIFETDWLTPAGVKGIPHTFVIKDGKLLLKVHPSYLTDEVVEGLLAGEDESEKVISGIQLKVERRNAFGLAMREFNQASAKQDVAAMTAALERARELADQPASLQGAEIQLAIAKKEWAGVAEMIGALDDSPMHAMMVSTAMRSLDAAPDAPDDLISAVLQRGAATTKTMGGPSEWLVKANLQWRVGQRDEAKASIQHAIEAAKEPRQVQVGFSAVPFEKIAASMENGEMPDKQLVTTWFREAYEKREAEKAAAEKP